MDWPVIAIAIVLFVASFILALASIIGYLRCRVRPWVPYIAPLLGVYDRTSIPTEFVVGSFWAAGWWMV